MAVSKRLRYEVLRRDNHTCRYCGAAAPDAPITIDHVVPVSLGGADDPSNLVAACRDCNAGKSSVPADAPMVADVAQVAVRWSAAMQKAADLRANEMLAEDDLLDQFECLWTAYWMIVPSENDTSTPYRHPGRWYAPRPTDWRQSVINFIASGLDIEFFAKAVRCALHESRHVEWENSWRYFCGICWRELDRRREIAYALLEADQ